jgi:flagellar biosynthesis protein FlhG
MLKRKAKIITVSGGKGGTGKTFVSVNLAVELAKQLPVKQVNEKTMSNSRVLLFDADFHLSNANLFLGIKQPSYLDKIMSKPQDIMSYIMTTEYGIDLISFGGDDKRINNTDLKFNSSILKELNKLEEFYDWIVVDTGAGLNRTIINQIIFADHVLFVLNPENTSLLDTYKLIKFISLEKEHPKIIEICANRVVNIDEALITFKKLEDTKDQFGVKMKLNFAGAVYYDKQTFDYSLFKGIPAVYMDDKPHMSQSFLTIVKNIQKGFIAKKVDSFFEKIFIEHQV